RLRSGDAGEPARHPEPRPPGGFIDDHFQQHSGDAARLRLRPHRRHRHHGPAPFNGIHLGSVAGWMTLHGKERALWGWIMPHGATELLAICLAGAAGYLLASALVAPGRLRRATALKRIGGQALTIELGCMAMLVIAGLIEGFVSPSGIDYPSRIGVLLGSLALWAIYFFGAGRSRNENRAEPSGEKSNSGPTP